jgi:hypothetical protein
MSDITAAHKKDIVNNWAQGGRTEGTLKPYSIGKKDSKIQQFASDQWSLATGDHNTSTAVLGSYTARYKILRANSTGVQARITIENSMTMSSFAHIVTGYGTKADKVVQRYDHDGVVAAFGAARSHYMEITFRVVIPN